MLCVAAEEHVFPSYYVAVWDPRHLPLQYRTPWHSLLHQSPACQSRKVPVVSCAPTLLPCIAVEERLEIGGAEVKAVFGSGNRRAAGCVVLDGALRKGCVIEVSGWGWLSSSGPRVVWGAHA